MGLLVDTTTYHRVRHPIKKNKFWEKLISSQLKIEKEKIETDNFMTEDNTVDKTRVR